MKTHAYVVGKMANAYRLKVCKPPAMPRQSNRAPSTEAPETPRPFLPWLGRACRRARQDKDVVQVQIAAALRVNQATIARFEDGTAWPRHPEDVLLAYATELDMDVRLLWLHAFVLWLENEPVLNAERQEEIRAALKRIAPPDDGG
jgi:transcriptional regulator with XRE-family HTH domain